MEVRWKAHCRFTFDWTECVTPMTVIQNRSHMQKPHANCYYTDEIRYLGVAEQQLNTDQSWIYSSFRVIIVSRNRCFLEITLHLELINHV